MPRHVWTAHWSPVWRRNVRYTTASQPDAEIEWHPGEAYGYIASGPFETQSFRTLRDAKQFVQQYADNANIIAIGSRL